MVRLTRQKRRAAHATDRKFSFSPLALIDLYFKFLVELTHFLSHFFRRLNLLLEGNTKLQGLHCITVKRRKGWDEKPRCERGRIMIEGDKVTMYSMLIPSTFFLKPPPEAALCVNTGPASLSLDCLVRLTLFSFLSFAMD